MRIFAVLVLILTISMNARAEEKTEEPGIGQIILDDLSCFGRDFLHVFGNIADLDMNDAMVYAGITAGTALSMPFDEEFRNFALRNQSSAADSYFDIHNEFGSIRGMSSIIGSTYLTGLLFDSEQIRVTGRLMFEALMFSGIYVQTMKMAIGRSRPFTGDPSGQYNWFESDNKYLSMPSGHSTGAFSMATVFALQYDRWWSYTIGYTLATGTALARTYKDQHWLSDVFLGACIGTLSGIAVVKAEEYFSKETEKTKNSRAFSINVFPGGINLKYKL